jgi:putative multiple sugar transport system ATP-binding protein
VGFAGLMGSSYGACTQSVWQSVGYRLDGEMYVRGKRKHFHHPQDAIGAGIAYVTEDRKGNGLILIQDVKQNITLANLKAIANRRIVDNNAEVKVANEYKNSLNIKTPSVEQIVLNLWCNQQKVSVANGCLSNRYIDLRRANAALTGAIRDLHDHDQAVEEA